MSGVKPLVRFSRDDSIVKIRYGQFTVPAWDLNAK
jgi:hypothetical protein